MIFTLLTSTKFNHTAITDVTAKNYSSGFAVDRENLFDSAELISGDVFYDAVLVSF